MLTFYHFPGACSQAVFVALEELGLAHRRVAVDLIRGEAQSAEFQAINPAGQIPALALPDGQLLSEAAAILTWLADTHPGADLLPTSPLARARAAEWMSFIGYSLHAASGPVWKPAKFLADPTREADIKAAGSERYLAALAVAEQRLGDKPWLLGEHYSLVDAYLLPFWHWPQRWRLDLSAFPRLAAWHQRMLARPAVQRVLAAEKDELKALLAK
ncbi:glutathione S-transferase family protein [Oryzomicrobium sp.]|uniref:glutathione S-transferase family protein n=1 Tax=Oryzomicrobium sp. TaxID=1911578 RepID=UPI002FE291DD